MFIGNQKALALLKVMASSNHPILLSGAPGCGKSTLAVTAAKGHTLTKANARNIKTSHDLYAYLKQANEFFFIDEIHALPNSIQESLYTIIDTLEFQVHLGRGSGKKIETVKLRPFALIGATTREDKLLAPFKQRFLTITLEPYTYQDIVQIIQHYLLNASYDIGDFGVPHEIAQYSRQTPRVAKEITKVFMQLNGLTVEDVWKTIQLMDIYPEGLTKTELNILVALNAQDLSLESLSFKLGLEEDVIRQEHEPFLIKKDLIARTRHGRTLTSKGKQYLQQLAKPRLKMIA